MIKKFQNQRLEILWDLPQIEAFRTPDHVELTEFKAIDLDLLQNCAGLNPKDCLTWDFLAALDIDEDDNVFNKDDNDIDEDADEEDGDDHDDASATADFDDDLLYNVTTRQDDKLVRK